MGSAGGGQASVRYRWSVGATIATIFSGSAVASGSTWMTYRRMAIPIMWEAASSARNFGSGTSSSSAIRSRSRLSTKVRSTLAAASWVSAERTIARSGARLAGFSQTPMKKRASRSPMVSRGPPTMAGTTVSRLEGHLDRGGEDLVLRTEVVVHERRVDPGRLGDAADRGLVVAALGELGAGRLQDAFTRARPALLLGTGRTAAAARGRFGHGRMGPGGAGGRRGEMEPGEGEGLREVGLAFGGGHRAAGVDLDHDVAVEAGEREALEELGAGLGAAPRDEVLVLGGAPAVGEVDVAEPVAHAVDHRQGVGAGGRGVREVDGEVPVVVLGDVPLGGVREHLSVLVPPRVHVLDGEPYVGLVRHPPDPGDEVLGVLALPAERGCTTTVDAPSRSAAAWARWSLTQGSVDQTRWVMRRQGACTARTGTWW